MSAVAVSLVKIVVFAVIRGLVYIGLWRLFAHAPFWVVVVVFPVAFFIALWLLRRLW